ncbi:MAG: hypothetical protein IKG03_01740 [Clostridiales bacterium]|nr:hypothetical protein [Clostridiales bacterium]
MKSQLKVTIIVCSVFLIVTTLLMLFVAYISTPSIDLKKVLCVPVSVKKVPEDQDILVQIEPCGLMPHGWNDEEHELSLNDINRGWITDYYDGKCRLVFLKEDSTGSEDVFGNYKSYGRNKEYYYAEIVPRNRVVLKNPLDLSKIKNATSDPFSEESHKNSCFIVADYAIPTYTWYMKLTKWLLIANVVFILFAVVFNVCISSIKKSKRY